MTYTTHRGFTRSNYTPIYNGTHDPDSFEGMKYDILKQEDEKLLNQLQLVESNAINIANKSIKLKEAV